MIACIEDAVVIKAIFAHLADSARGARALAAAGPGGVEAL